MFRSSRRKKKKRYRLYNYVPRRSEFISVPPPPHWSPNFRLKTPVNGLHIQSNDRWGDFVGGNDRQINAMKDIFSNVEALLSVTDRKFTRPLDILESFLLTYYNISRTTNHADFVNQMMILFKLVYKDKRADTLKGWIKHIENFFQTDITSPVQSRETVDMMRAYFDGASGYVNNPLFKKCRKLFSFLLTQGLLSELGIKLSEEDFSKFEIRNYRQNYSSKIDLWWCVLDTTISFLERIEDYRETGKFSEFIHGRDKYSTWMTKTDKLLSLAQFTGNLEAHGTNTFEYRADVASQLEIGKAMLQHIRATTGTTNAMLNSKFNDLQLLQAREVTRKAAQQERLASFAVLINGKSSVGKSTFTKMLYKFTGKLLKYPICDSFLYRKPPTDDFWSGFMSSMWCIQVDDVAFLDPVKATMDQTLEEILNVVNNVPFNPPQAALEDKGKTPVRAELVLATTNQKDLNAYHYFACPLAILRRFPMVITLEVKEEYKSDNKVMDGKAYSTPFLDPGKLPSEKIGWPDYWRVHVQEIVPDCRESHQEGKDYAKFNTIAIFEDINNFLTYYGNRLKEHRKYQSNCLSTDAAMSLLNVCSNCCSTYTVECSCGHQNEFQVQSMTRYELDDIRREQNVIDPLFKIKLFIVYILSLTCSLLASLMNVGSVEDVLAYQPVLEDGYYKLRVFSLCHSCWHPTNLCRCYQVQAGETVESSPWYRNRYFLSFWELLIIIHTYLCYFAYVTNFLRLMGHYRALRYAANSWILPRLRASLQVQILGDWVTIRRKKKIITIIAILGIFSAAYLGYRSIQKVKEVEKPEPAVGYRDTWIPVSNFDIHSSTPRETVDDRFKKESDNNVWYKQDIGLTTFDVPISSVSLSKASQEQIVGMLQRNCVKLRVRFWCSQRQAHIIRDISGVFVKGQYLLTHSHAFPELDISDSQHSSSYDVTIITNVVDSGVTPNVRFKLYPNDICRLPGDDLAMITVRSVPPYKDITKYWAIKENGGVSKGLFLRRNDDGLIEFGTVRAAILQSLDIPQVVCSGRLYMAHLDTLTKEGQCGSLLINQSAFGPIIVGMHLLGRNHHVGYLSVTMEEINKLIGMCQEQFGDMTVCGGGEPMLNTSDTNFVLSSLHYKSMIRYCERGLCNVYGTLRGFRVNPKSKVTQTPYAETVCEFFNYEIKHGPPSMKGWKPWRNNLIDMIEPTIKHNRTELHTVATSFLQDIKNLLPDGWEKRLHVLSDYEAINGIPGVKFIDSIKRSTSMGHPWCETKKRHLKAEPRENYPDGVNFSEDVWNRINEMKNNYLKGFRNFPIFTEHLKDEATSMAKIAIEKTRAFSGAPVDMAILTRQYFLSLVKLLQENKFVFEAAPGTNPASKEWGEFYHYLTKFGAHKMIAGDYGKYDKKMIADLVLEAFWILISLHKMAGFTEEEICIMWGISTDTAFPLVNFNGDLLEFFGTNPSGHPLTVIINSIVNSLYMRLVYYRLNPDKECHTFKDKVALMTYGDDNIMGVCDTIPWFNHTAIQNELAKIGVVYTMPDKESESIPYVHIDTCEFLKRKWRFEESINMFACPLNLSSVLKSLTVWVPSTDICAEEQFVEVLINTNMEAFFHGREVFNKYHTFCNKMLENRDLHVYLPDGFITWDQFVEKFKNE